jgi:polynucleotide 5'-hydroxyl-kinase GRC3/NOL9
MLKGPAEITSLKDSLTALGKPLAKQESIHVRRGKVMPFETSATSSTAKIVLRKNADFWMDTGWVGVKIWWSLINELFYPTLKAKQVIIVGATDSGKSTLSTYLLNTALSKGLSAAVVDEDVGQGDLAPPGCVGGAALQTPVFDLRDVKSDLLGFVGAISPSGVEDIVRKEVSLVARRLKASGSSFTVINTDGYIASEGVTFKARMIQDLNPDAVVCFEDQNRDQLLFNKLRAICDCDVVLAKRPSYSVKSSSERAVRRMSQYRRFLRGEQRLRISLQEKKLRFLGHDYSSNSAETNSNTGLFMKIGAEGRRLILQQNLVDDVAVIEHLADGETTVLPTSSLNGMFLGLGSAETVKFGRCVKIHSDFSIDVLTDIAADVGTVFLSIIRLRKGLRREAILPIVKSAV